MSEATAGSTTAKKLRVLIVQDNPDDAQLIVRELQSGLGGVEFDATVVETEPAFVDAVAAGTDVILCDHSLPQFGAPRAFEILRERAMTVPMIVVSGTITEELAVQYMQRGAADYVLKDRLRRLGPAVSNAIYRYRLQIEAAEAHRRLSQLLEDMDIAEISSDLYGNVISCNDVAVRLLGYESKESAMAIRTVANYVNPEGRTKLLRLLGERGTVQDYEIAFKGRDGSTVWTTGHYHATKDESGRITGIQALIVDSTSRKQAEREAEVSRQRLDSALGSAPMLLATLDQDLRFTFVGGMALNRAKVDPKTMIGASARELLKERPDILRSLERASTGEEFEAEGQFTGRYFHVKYSPVLDSADQGRGVAVVALDITARHTAELRADARARHQFALRSLAESALMGTWQADLCERAAKLVKEALLVDHASVFEFDPASNTAHRVAGAGISHLDDTVSGKSGIPAWVFAHREVRAIEELLPEDLNDMPFLRRMGVKALLVAPIRGEESLFGALGASGGSPRRWTDDEREFIEMMAQTLWSAIERRRLEDDRSELLRRLVEAQEQERKRIAADVHDDAVQVMSAVLMRLHLFEKELTDTNLRRLVSKLSFTVSLSIERLRSLLFELGPPALEQLGLQTALQTLIEEFQREYGVVAELTGGLNSEPESGSSLAIYRIVQEALINVHKHAEAKRLTLAIHDLDGGVRVRLEDDGRGCDLSSPAAIGLGHVGLSAMRQRAELVGGWWKIQSEPGSGTQIEFWVPARAGASRAAAS